MIVEELILVSRPSQWPQTAACLVGADRLQTRDQVEKPHWLKRPLIGQKIAHPSFTTLSLVKTCSN